MKWIDDFDAEYPPEIRRRIRRTKICRQFLQERARIADLAVAIRAQGGDLNDPTLMEELEHLTLLEHALRRRIAAILEQADCSAH